MISDTMLTEFMSSNKSNIILDLGKDISDESTVTETLEKYHHSGVWVMVGRSVETKEWICLEVGETGSIYEELNADCKEILKVKREVQPPEITECAYSFRRFRPWSKPIPKTYGQTRYKAKYRAIATDYDEIRIYKVSDSDIVEERYKTEVHYAMTLKAAYWYPAPCNRRCRISQWQEVKKYE